MVFGSDRITMKYRMSGRTARTRDDVLGASSRVTNRISEGMGGVAGQVVRPFQRIQENTNARNTAKMNENYTPPTSSGSLYSDPSVLGQDTTAQRPNTMGGGQGTQKKATCMAFCVSTKGTGRSGLKYCEKSCRGLK